jgi:hypothetical protein
MSVDRGYRRSVAIHWSRVTPPFRPWLVLLTSVPFLAFACAAPTAHEPRARVPVAKTPVGQQFAQEYAGPLSMARQSLDLINDDYRKGLGVAPPFALANATARFYVAPVRCGQGPFEVRIATDETGWHDIVSLYVLSPRVLRGWVEDGRFPQNAAQPFNHDFEPPDNQRCVLSASEAAAARQTASTAGGGPSLAPPAPGSGGPAPKPTSAPPTALREIAQPASLPRVRLYQIEWRSMSIRDPLGGPSRQGPPELIFRVWFDTPNDLEGVVFVSEVATTKLVTPEGEYRALMRAVKQKDDQKSQEQRRQEVETVARYDHCQAHHEDQTCWPRGYERMMAEVAEGQRRNEAERKAAAQRRAEEAKLHPPPPPAKPERAPPAPRPETTPPRPSANATWVAGYWQWIEGGWLWLGGRWHVPEADVQRELTVHAPTPPPAPRAEPPLPAPVAPPPAPTASAPAAQAARVAPPVVVWTPGFWQWDGARWVWVAGVWQRPPQAGATWQPDRWQRRGGGAVFLPGGWQIRVAP